MPVLLVTTPVIYDFEYDFFFDSFSIFLSAACLAQNLTPIDHDHEDKKEIFPVLIKEWNN